MSSNIWGSGSPDWQRTRRVIKPASHVLEHWKQDQEDSYEIKFLHPHINIHTLHAYFSQFPVISKDKENFYDSQELMKLVIIST